jgi:hypothetical protein
MLVQITCLFVAGLVCLPFYISRPVIPQYAQKQKPGKKPGLEKIFMP